MLEHVSTDKANKPLRPTDKASLSLVITDQFTRLCQELGATILEEHKNNLKLYGSVKMSFEFPNLGIDTAILTINNGNLVIRRCRTNSQETFFQKA